MDIGGELRILDKDHRYWRRTKDMKAEPGIFMNAFGGEPRILNKGLNKKI